MYNPQKCAHAAILDEESHFDDALSEGRVECLKHLHESGYDFDDSACEAAVTYGHLDCLKYLHEAKPELYEEWFYCSQDIAAGNGSLDILEYMDEIDLDSSHFNHRALFSAAEEGHLDCLKYLYKQQNPKYDWLLVEVTARHNQFDCFKWILKHAYLDDDKIYEAAVLGGVEYIEWLHLQANGSFRTKLSWGKLRWSHSACTVAAEHDRLDCLRYLHEEGCPVALNTCVKCLEMTKTLSEFLMVTYLAIHDLMLDRHPNLTRWIVSRACTRWRDMITKLSPSTVDFIWS